MKLSHIAAAGVAAILLLAGCSSTDDNATEPTTPAMTTPSETASQSAAGTIVEVAQSNPDFSTLVSAVQAAGLVETLSGDGPFTVFAPTNEAFAALPDGVLDALLLPENKDALTSILTYHVVSGEVTSDMVKPGDVKTVEGSTIKLAVADDGSVKVNDSNVTAVDVDASNGVIHVIDAVLVPSTVDVGALTS
jgi:uncharacterized surface protein with fasciclin (FAS1) repeats